MVRAEVSAAMAEEQVSGVDDEGVIKVAGVRCRQRAWAGGVDGEGRGVGSGGGGVGGVAKVQEVSTVRAEVSCAHGSQCQWRRCRRCRQGAGGVGSKGRGVDGNPGVGDEGVIKVAGVRCRRRAWAGGVDGEGRRCQW